MSTTPRRQWIAMLAKLTSPLESTAAGQAFNAYLPLLQDFPDAAFTPASVDYVASQCHGVPTYADVRAGLGAWWRLNRPPPPALQAPPQADPLPRSKAEIAAAARVVGATTAALKAEALYRESMQLTLPRAGNPARYLSRAQLDLAYKQAGVSGPTIPRDNVTPLRPVAAHIRPETRKGPHTQ